MLQILEMLHDDPKPVWIVGKVWAASDTVGRLFAVETSKGILLIEKDIFSHLKVYFLT